MMMPMMLESYQYLSISRRAQTSHTIDKYEYAHMAEHLEPLGFQAHVLTEILGADTSFHFKIISNDRLTMRREYEYHRYCCALVDAYY